MNYSTEPIDLITQRLLQQGVLRYWVQLEKHLNQIKGRRLSYKFRSPKYHEKDQSKDSGSLHLFIVILAGEALAIIVFACENLIYWIEVQFWGKSAQIK